MTWPDAAGGRILGRSLLTVANVITVAAPVAADWNDSHIFNERWPAHARFHGVTALGSWIGTSTLRRENSPVAHIFITGSTDGLGRGAASVLMGEGHDVVLHARTLQRAAALSDLAPDASGVVIGDLSSAAETRELADQVNDIGPDGRCHPQCRRLPRAFP